jgi:2-hydroxy-3-keto-5-methylthiopentenyl-1-phosphate phosphatase
MRMTVAPKQKKMAVLCDFDGTIVDIDTGALILEKFGQGDWRELDLKLERREISLEECLASQYAMVKVSSKDVILDMLRKETIKIRSNFRAFVNYCRTKNFPFVITTGGIDFCINSVLNSNGFPQGSFLLHSGKTKYSKDGLKIVFPKLSNKSSANFKQDIVNHYQDLNFKVAYVGDGASDYEPSRRADLVFAVRSSSLARMCKNNSISCYEFEDFEEVIGQLD